MRAGLIVLGVIIIAGIWLIANTQTVKTLPLVGPLTGRVASLPSIEPVAYVVGGLVVLMGLFMSKKASKNKAKEETEIEEDGESEEDGKFCTQCGAELEGKFCSECGKKAG